MIKQRVTQEYEKLSDEIQEQVKLVYPYGFSDHLISYVNKDGQRVSALRFETDEKIYLIRMTFEQAKDIIESDDDYDDEGNLMDDVREDYEEKHSDVDYLTENENYEEPDEDSDNDSED